MDATEQHGAAALSCCQQPRRSTDHIATVRRSGYLQLRQLRCIRRLLTTAVTKTLLQVSIDSRLDYCLQRFVRVSGGQAAVTPERSQKLFLISVAW